jgi:hypothetical protein
MFPVVKKAPFPNQKPQLANGGMIYFFIQAFMLIFLEFQVKFKCYNA